MSNRSPTWPTSLLAASAPTTNMTKPSSSQEVREVAMYSMATNSPMNTALVPMSLSKTSSSRRAADRGMASGRVDLRRQAVHHHDAEAVEQRREREQQRVRPGGELPHGQVRPQDNDQVGGQVLRHPRGQLAVEAEAHVGHGEHDQGEGEGEHDQLGAPPAAGHREHRARRINGRRRGGYATHALPEGAGTRALAGMP